MNKLMTKLIERIPYFKRKKELELELQWKEFELEWKLKCVVLECKSDGIVLHADSNNKLEAKFCPPEWTKPLKEGIPIKPIKINFTMTTQYITKEKQ